MYFLVKICCLPVMYVALEEKQTNPDLNLTTGDISNKSQKTQRAEKRVKWYHQRSNRENPDWKTL